MAQNHNSQLATEEIVDDLFEKLKNDAMELSHEEMLERIQEGVSRYSDFDPASKRESKKIRNLLIGRVKEYRKQKIKELYGQLREGRRSFTLGEEMPERAAKKAAVAWVLGFISGIAFVYAFLQSIAALMIWRRDCGTLMALARYALSSPGILILLLLPSAGLTLSLSSTGIVSAFFYFLVFLLLSILAFLPLISLDALRHATYRPHHYHRLMERLEKGQETAEG